METDDEIRRILGFDLAQAAIREGASKPEERFYVPLGLEELRRITQVLENIVVKP